MTARHSPSMTANRATLREAWSQKWLHVSVNHVIRARSIAYGVLEGMPWAKGVAGSNPVAPTKIQKVRSDRTGHTSFRADGNTGASSAR